MPERDMTRAHVSTRHVNAHTKTTSCLFIMSRYTVSVLGLFEQTQEGYAEQINVPPESQCSAQP